MFSLALSAHLWASIACMLLYGFGFVLFFVNTNTMIQLEVPDEFRGRVMSLFTLTFLGLMPIGALIVGAIANEIGTPTTLALCALINGGLGAVILVRWPTVWRMV
jgi:MFS family permease